MKRLHFYRFHPPCEFFFTYCIFVAITKLICSERQLDSSAGISKIRNIVNNASARRETRSDVLQNSWLRPRLIHCYAISFFMEDTHWSVYQVKFWQTGAHKRYFACSTWSLESYFVVVYTLARFKPWCMYFWRKRSLRIELGYSFKGNFLSAFSAANCIAPLQTSRSHIKLFLLRHVDMNDNKEGMYSDC